MTTIGPTWSCCWRQIEDFALSAEEKRPDNIVSNLFIQYDGDEGI